MNYKCILIATLLVATPALASPILLASFDDHLGRPASAPAEPRVEFVLTAEADGAYAVLGVGRTWEEGARGSVDFNESTDPQFRTFAEIATNGVDDELRDGVFWQGSGGGGGTLAVNRESSLYGRPTDLIGYNLDFVRLTVHRVEFEPFVFPTGHEGLSVDYDLTYDFYGTPIPEPATGVLLMCAFVAWKGLGACIRRDWPSRTRAGGEA